MRRQTQLPPKRLTDSLAGRPVIYGGGGSYFKTLARAIYSFTDVKTVSSKQWNTSQLEDLEEINAANLFGILSTAYGLSMSVASDNIDLLPFREIFKGARETQSPQKSKPYSGGKGPLRGFNYTDDYSAWK